MLLGVAASLQAFPSGRQTYFILGHEQLILNILKVIDNGEFAGNFLPNPPRQASSVVSLTVPASGQRIIYDHGEDGYEADLTNPVQASTEIWGDGDPSNGIPPGDPGGDDILTTSQVISLESTLTGTCGATCNPVPINPRGTNLRWDGSDIAFTVGQPMTAVHTIFPADGNTGSGSQTVIGGTWELFPLETYDENLIYTVPVGVDTYSSAGGDGGYFENFKYCEIVVQATEDDTAVIIDNQAGPPVSFLLDRGESWSSLGDFSSGAASIPAVTINQNTTIMGEKPLQVGLVTANSGAFGTRFYNIIPTGIYASEYMSPVFSSGPRPPAAAHEADIFVNNPNFFDIQVTAEDITGQTVFTVPANSAASLAQAAGRYIPPGSAVRLSSPNLFWGIGAYDTGGRSGDGTGADWGWVLQANGFLENAVTCPHGPGNSGVVDPSQTNNLNGSPIWVGVLDDNTTVTVDWDGDGTPDPADTDNDGAADGTSFTLAALQGLTLYDPSGDNNQAPARIEADGDFSAAWGYGGTGGSEDPGVFTNVDWGYSINPFDFRFMEPLIDMEKSANPKSVIPPATVEFTLVASSGSLVPVTDVDIVDVLPDSSWSYVPGSAVITYPDQSTIQLDPTTSGQTLTWDISHTLQTQEKLEVTFQAAVGVATGCSPSATTVTEDWDTPSSINNPASYQNGSAGWTGNWIETGENTNPTNGNIRVRGSTSCFDNHLEIRRGRQNSSNARYVYRQLDTTGFCSPQVQFTYETRGLTGGNESMVVEASTDGVNYTNIRTYQSATGGCATQVLDLSGYQSATTYLRFGGDPDNSSTGDRLLVDDIVVSDAGSAPADITEDFEDPGSPSDPESYLLGTGWSGDWDETGDDDDPTSGTIQVSSGTAGSTCNSSNHLRFVGGSGDSISRRLDLSGFVSPQLSFDFRIAVTAGDEFYHLEASPDGSSWTTLQTWGQADNSGTCQNVQFDLSPYTTAGAQLRFRGSGGLDNSGGFVDYFEVDNLVVTETGASGGGPASQWDNEARATGFYKGFPVASEDDERVYNNALVFTKVVSHQEARFGDVVTYDLTLQNISGSDIPDLEVRDPIPAFSTLVGGSPTPNAGTSPAVPVSIDPGSKTIVWDVGTLAAGQTLDFQFQVTVGQVPFDRTPMTNRATVIFNGIRGLDSNITETIVRTPIFQLLKKAPGAVSPSGVIRYDFDLYNNGEAPATGVLVTDRIPADTVYYHDGNTGPSATFSDDNGTSFAFTPGAGANPTVTHVRFAVGSMPVASLTTAGFSVQVASGTPTNTILRNYATLINNETTIRTTNIAETVVTDLQLTLSSQQSVACPRRRLQFTQLVENNGTSAFTGVEVVQPIPEHSDYEYLTASAPAGWSLEYSTDSAASFTATTPAAGVAVTHLRFTTPSLPPGASDALRFDTRVSQFVPAGVSVETQGDIDSNETPRFSSNLLVQPTVNVRVVKTADRLTADPGDTITWTLTVQNIGARAVTGATLEDPLVGFNVFTETTLVPGSSSPPAAVTGSGLSWNLPTLIPLGPSLTYTFQSVVNGGASPGTSILNMANTEIPGLCDIPSNLSQVLIANTGVSAGPDGEGYGNQGDTVFFPARVTNESASVSDTFSFGVVSSDPTDWPVGTTIQVYLDLDGDGIYDPSLDVPATDTGVLTPGQTRHILVAITIPGSVPDLDTNDFTFTATSTSNPSNSDSFGETIHVIGPTMVFLTNLKAVAVPGGVQVSWRTLREFQNQGFELSRGPSPVGPWEQVGCCMIPGMGTFPSARDYSILDPDAPGTGPLFYRLVDVDFLGRRRRHPPVGVDRDGDGLAFDLEARHGLSDSDPGDASSDPDGDGLSTAEELLQGTDPIVAQVTGSAPLVTSSSSTPPPDGIRVLEEGDDYQVLEFTLGGYELTTRVIAGEVHHYPELTSLLSGHSERAGWPRLPVVGTHLPPGLDLVDWVEVEEQVEESILVGPAPHAEDGHSNLMPRYTPAPEFYQGSGSYPEAPVQLTPGADNETPGRLLFQPFTYDHGNRRLTFMTRIRVRVESSGLGVARAALVASTGPGLSGIPPGTVFRLRTDEPGMYRLTGAQMRGAGVPVDTLDPRNLALYRDGVEIPIRVTGEDDAVLHDGDALEFYADHPGDRYAAGDGFHLLLGSTPGKRWSEASRPAPLGPFQESYRHREEVRYRDYYSTPIPGAPEEDRFVVHRGLWVDNNNPQSFPVEVRDPAPEGSQAILELTYGASLDFEGERDHHHLLSFDGVPVGEETWSGAGFHPARAALPPSALTPGTHQVGLALSLEGLPAGTTFDFVAPRDLVLEYDRIPLARGDLLTLESVADEGLDLQVGNFSQPEVTVLEISNPLAPVLQRSPQVTGAGPHVASLGLDPSEDSERFLFYTPSGTRTPSLRPVNRTTLRNPTRRAGWLAVVPDPSYVATMTALVALRASQGLEPLVVTLEELADEFTSGVVHPESIRRFLQHARSSWARSPDYLLLVGEGNANPRGYAGLFSPGFPFTSDPVTMPTPLSMSGPGFLRRETGDDAWYGRLSGGDDLPEVAVGRWPVKSVAETATMVTKAVAYAAATGSWRGRILSVADDGEPEFSEFSQLALGNLPPGLQVQELFQSNPDFGGLAGYRTQLQAALGGGGLLLQFVGHGSFSTWTDDTVLDTAGAGALGNGAQLPFVISMTCEDGYFANVAGSAPTLAEAMTLNPSGGSIAYLASGIQTTAEAKDLLHRSLVEALFQRDKRRAGDMVREGSSLFLANSEDQENLLRAFNLIGDPATQLRLRNPLQPVSLTAIFLSDGSVRVTWDLSSDPDVSGYEVYRRVGNGPLVQLGQASAPPFLVPGNNQAASAADQYFTVRAVTSDGFGSSLPPEVRADTNAATAAPTPTPTVAVSSSGGGGGSSGCEAVPAGRGDPLTPLLGLLAFLGIASRRRRTSDPTHRA